jgi:uncharacterized protein (DUF4415 family)
MSGLSKSERKFGRSSTNGMGKRSASLLPIASVDGKSDNIVRYTLDELRKLPDRTDWAKVDSMTEEDHARLDAEDADLQGFEDIDWSKAEWVDYRPKQAISIRLDPDVLEHFKAGGKGYQKRINAVLRSYVNASKKAG